MPTKCSSNKGFSGNSSILPRINFGVGRQESSPQSLTTTTLDRFLASHPNSNCPLLIRSSRQL
jgi:hypothetical protein